MSLTVVNVGNTHVRLAVWAGETKREDRRVPTAEAARLLPAPEGEIALVSVVPAAADELLATWGRPAFTVTAASVPGLRLDYDPPEALGADRLANALALWRLHGPGIAIDCGTATTLTLVDEQGVLRGGAILPGLATARDSLWKATAQLPAVPLEAPARPLGRSTLESLQVGLVHGHAGAIDHLVARMRAAFPSAAALVVTGGWGPLLAGLLPGATLAPDLTLEGARLAFAERPSARPLG